MSSTASKSTAVSPEFVPTTGRKRAAAAKAAAKTVTTSSEDSIVESCQPFANGFGKWRAKITFTHSLSENDPRESFNVKSYWSRLRRRARRDIITELLSREQKTNETELEARGRISKSLGTLIVIEQNISAQNLWYGVTFGEA